MSWNQGLFNCCGNCCNCLFVYFCPCWSLGKVADHVGDSCCLCTLLSFVAFPCLMFMERGKMRAKYAIDGGAVGDGLVSCFCPCCGLSQMMAQMDYGGMAKDGEVITTQPKSLNHAVDDPNVISSQPI